MSGIGKPPMSEERSQAIVDTYRGGKSLWQTGKIFGVSGVAIFKLLKRLGIPRRDLKVAAINKYVQERMEKEDG